MVQSVTNRLGQSGPAGEPGEQFGEPCLHRLDQRPGLFLAHAQPLGGGPATDVYLDRIKSAQQKASLTVSPLPAMRMKPA
jgi:hypothetical protein